MRLLAWLCPVRQVGRPFHQFLLQFFLAGQIELVFPGVDVGALGQRDFNQRLVLLLGTTMPTVALSASVLTWRSK